MSGAASAPLAAGEGRRVGLAGARRRARRRRHPVRLALLTALVAGASAWAGALAAVVLGAHQDRARPADAIVVMGAAQYDGRPSPVLRARLDHAIALWRAGLAPTLVVTGGARRGDRSTEAAASRRYAVARGVPDSVILLESEGRTTRESVRAAAVLLHELQRTTRTADRTAGAAQETTSTTAPVPATPAPRAILVSDPFHMLRLGVLARRFGLDPYTSPTRTSPIGASVRRAWAYYLRESVKVPFVLLTEKLDDD